MRLADWVFRQTLNEKHIVPKLKTMTTEEKITEILYKNSQDNGEGLVIKFENVQPIIELFTSEVRQEKIKILEELWTRFDENENHAAANHILVKINELREEGKEKV